SAWRTAHADDDAQPQQQQQQHPIQPQQQRGAMPRASNGMPIPSDGALGGRHSLPSRPMGVPPMDRHKSPEFAPQQHAPLNHPHHSLHHQQQQPYHRYSYSDRTTSLYGYDDAFKSLQFPDDSFPPPPPLDSFVATSLPSWSPPPARAKKLDTVAPPPVPMAFYASQPAADAATRNGDHRAAAGLSRRPSMTVPWQVAEPAQNTPQTTSPAAEAAAELGALALGRQRSTNAGLPLSTSPPTSSGRRGSFGNAAEFFKFRRRSKSRLELARDLATYAQENNGATSATGYGTMSTLLMPGIDERHDNMSVVAHAAESSDDDDDDDDDATTGQQLRRASTAAGGGGSFISFYDATRARADSLDGLSQLSIPPPPPPPLTDDDDDDASTTLVEQGALPIDEPQWCAAPQGSQSLRRRGSLSSERQTRVKDEIIPELARTPAPSHAARYSQQQDPSRDSECLAAATDARRRRLRFPRPAVKSVRRCPPSVMAMPAPPPGFSRAVVGRWARCRENRRRLHRSAVTSNWCGVALATKASPPAPTQQRKTAVPESSSLESDWRAAERSAWPTA
ncbi:hypothetical protein PINS_up018619, partial [Pythium insidiosum]